MDGKKNSQFGSTPDYILIDGCITVLSRGGKRIRRPMPLSKQLDAVKSFVGAKFLKKRLRLTLEPALLDYVP
jgi:hypothetical protein